MNVEKAVKTRRSVRRYTTEEVSSILLEDIVELASYAPSWKNSQTPGYVMLLNRELLDDIAENGVCGFAHNTDIIRRCQALAIMTTTTGICGYNKDGSFTTKKKDKWEMFDAGVAAQTFMLVAHDKGLGSVVLGIFDEDYIAQKIGLEDGKSISALIALGYPAEVPLAPQRKSVEELIKIIK